MRQRTWCTNIVGHIPTVPTSERTHRKQQDQHRNTDLIARRREFAGDQNQSDAQVCQPFDVDQVDDNTCCEQYQKHCQFRPGILHTLTNHTIEPNMAASYQNCLRKGSALQQSSLLIALSFWKSNLHTFLAAISFSNDCKTIDLFLLPSADDVADMPLCGRLDTSWPVIDQRDDCDHLSLW